MGKVCYVEEGGPGHAAPPGYKLWHVTTDKAARKTAYFGRKPAAQWLIVYKDSCLVAFADLEVVSFVRGELATGYVCSCNLRACLKRP